MSQPTNAYQRNGAVTNLMIVPMHLMSKIAIIQMLKKVRHFSLNMKMLAPTQHMFNKPPAHQPSSYNFYTLFALLQLSIFSRSTCITHFNPFSFNFYSTFFFNSSRPFDVVIPKAPSKTKTKLEPIALNDPIDILDKAKRNRVKNDATINDSSTDDDEEDIQGDASGITIPLSKSLGMFWTKTFGYLIYKRKFLIKIS